MTVQSAFGKHVLQAQNLCTPDLWPSADVIIFVIWTSQKERSELIHIHLHLSSLFYVYKSGIFVFRFVGKGDPYKEVKLELGSLLIEGSILGDVALVVVVVCVFCCWRWGFLFVVVFVFFIFSMDCINRRLLLLISVHNLGKVAWGGCQHRLCSPQSNCHLHETCSCLTVAFGSSLEQKSVLLFQVIEFYICCQSVLSTGRKAATHNVNCTVFY